jgi:hypothetical protein
VCKWIGWKSRQAKVVRAAPCQVDDLIEHSALFAMALGTILAPTRTYYIKRVGRSHVARAVSYRGNIEIDIGAK